MNNSKQFRDAGFLPRLHGNGFIQIDLSPIHRLHVFHPELIQYGQKVRSEMHTHAFDMHSRVLHGCMIHNVYNISEKQNKQMVNVYEAVYDGMMTKDSSLVRSKKFPSEYSMELEGIYTMATNSEYMFMNGLWHTSQTNGLTVTVIEKIPVLSNHSAYVACNVGSLPETNYKRDNVSPKILDTYLDDALKFVSQEINKYITNE